MKKIILLPKTDTVILCLPEQWAGIPVICELTPLSNYTVNSEEVKINTAKIVAFHNDRKRKKKI
jgi:hypothetical protein